MKTTSPIILTAEAFTSQLTALRTKPALEAVQKFFRDEGVASKFIGVKMGSLFALAKAYTAMPLKEIATLLDSAYYEARMGAVCIMDFQAREKKITPEKRKELFDLYLKKHRKIDNWDMVDRAAPHVIGGYLIDKPRKVLYTLAKSKNVYERRTAIVSTWYFIRQGDVQDTFNIAALLVKDNHDLIHKAVGSWIREAGKRDKHQLLSFLNKYAKNMPAIMLRYATEKLSTIEKKQYAELRKRAEPRVIIR